MLSFLEEFAKEHQNEPEYTAAVMEVGNSLTPYLAKHPEDIPAFKKLLKPNKIISFDVHWVDDAGKERINKGYRVQYCNILGPYKGGLRFHPSVNLSILQMLAFEQTFKNALTGLPMGGAKGGSDFDPKGKSEAEVERFCRAFMNNLCSYIRFNFEKHRGVKFAKLAAYGDLFMMWTSSQSWRARETVIKSALAKTTPLWSTIGWNGPKFIVGTM